LQISFLLLLAIHFDYKPKHRYSPPIKFCNDRILEGSTLKTGYRYVVLTKDGKITGALKNNIQLSSTAIIGVVSERPSITGGYKTTNSVPIGLVGRLKVSKQSPVHPNWKKTKNIDSNFDEWLVK